LATVGNAPGFVTRQQTGRCLPARFILEIHIRQLLAGTIDDREARAGLKHGPRRREAARHTQKIAHEFAGENTQKRRVIFQER
jgi:hypothetical protein